MTPTVEQNSLGSDSERIGGALGRIPSGCYVLTTSHRGQSTGLLVSWVQQASFAPPSVTVAIRHGRPVSGLIEGSRRFLLNVMGEDAAAWFRHFGRGFSLAEDAFAGLETEATAYGPLLLSCVAQIACDVESILAAGDHTIYLGRVAAGHSNGHAPYVHVRKSGMSY